MPDENSAKLGKIYKCNMCHYNCSYKSDLKKHLLTRKHLHTYNTLTNTDEISTKLSEYSCECGNTYKHRQSLFNHKKRCSIVQVECNSKTNNSPTVDIDKELLIKMLLKNQDIMEGVILKNSDIMDKMIEMMPNMGMNISNNSHNTTNNQFNIQMFLNDHCKNAMNLTDFIQSLPITSETYDSTIENGLTKTITSMMLNGLNDLDILERPIHCTDVTRKTLYVKDSDKWEKDNESLHILKGIKELSLKQRTLISKWREVNEGWQTDDKLQSKMTNLVFNSMTQIESDEKETGKIIRSISKSVYLDNETKEKYT